MIRSVLARRVTGRPRWPAATDNIPAIGLCLLVPAIFYYAFLITAVGSTGLLAPVPYGLTFNSMLSHLLVGRFDVDPSAIGPEGYARDGAVYAYFGIFPALFRALFLPLPNFATTDFTRLSCLSAVSLMALFKVLSALVVWRKAGSPRRSALLPLFLAVILAGGAQVQFLRPTIFEEVMLWADAFAAAFVYLVLHAWAGEEGFTTRVMSALAGLAGLCILTRVSTALGLYLALGFIFLWRCWLEIGRSTAAPLWKRLPVFSLPMMILAGFAAVAAIVNQERWGNPLVFVDLTRSLMTVVFPGHFQQLHQYGEFNFSRLGYGLVYYFLPVWVLHDQSGQLLWSGFVERQIATVELPPSSFFLSDPLIVGLAVYGTVGLVRNRIPHRAPIALAACGLAVPAGLMLIAIVMAFRYRMEFYPLLELCALIGFWRVLAAPSRSTGIAFGAAALFSILAAQALWLIYMLSPFGSAGTRLGESGIVQFYLSLFH
ncbi:MAG: hypothetical protein ACHQC9_05810 [Alphaproteobacteria bacterium]